MIIVIGIGTYAYLDGLAFQNAAASAERSRLIVAQTQGLLSHLIDAEANQTEYLLTGDRRYLAAYQQALSMVAPLSRYSAGRRSPAPRIAYASPR
jgi:CHASE3 domain sensor protein